MQSARILYWIYSTTQPNTVKQPRDGHVGEMDVQCPVTSARTVSAPQGDAIANLPFAKGFEKKRFPAASSKLKLGRSTTPLAMVDRLGK